PRPDLSPRSETSPHVYRGPLVVYYPVLPAREHELYLGAALITGGADRREGIAHLQAAMDPDVPAGGIAGLAEAHLAEQDAGRAARMFRQAVDKAPRTAKLHYNLAQALDAAGDSSGARAQFEETLRLQPSFPEAHYALANLLMKIGDLALAAEHYRAAVRV